MRDIILDTLIDSIKLLPFLILSYVIIELIEHKSSKKMEHILAKSGKFGPLLGSLLGIVPQCGFSVTASNFYAGRIISLGTLISVYLSTSDEAIPVMISHPELYKELIILLLVKFSIGFIAGFLIDLILRKINKNKTLENDYHEHIHHDICNDCQCDKKPIWLSVIKHSLKIFVFILIVSFILNTIIHLLGDELLKKLLLSGSIFQPFIASLIGLIPNCASSVLITELYISGSLSFASLVSGLVSAAGVGIVVLFEVNKNVKENLKILSIVYLIGSLCGILLNIFNLFV